MTTSQGPEPLLHPMFVERGIEHGFGVKGWAGPRGLARPEQVHGIDVAVASRGGGLEPQTADAVVAGPGGPPVGVVTADCVPILLGSNDGRRVAAIHAGWRGLAAGVIAAAFATWDRVFDDGSVPVAVIGPHAGPCCYEVDEPVRAAFAARGRSVLVRSFTSTRPGHWMADLAVLAAGDLRAAGLRDAEIGRVEDACTICGGDRFESYRRDGAAAGRMVHSITPRRLLADAPVDPS